MKKIGFEEKDICGFYRCFALAGEIVDPYACRMATTDGMLLFDGENILTKNQYTE